MKKIVIIVATVLALVILTLYADRLTRVTAKSGTASGAIIGKPAPEIKLKDINDKDVSLADLKGKVVFVNFWATWCDPCRIEIPWLIELQAKYGPKGFTVVGVAMDEEGKSAVAPFVAKERFDVNGQQLSMSYPIWIGSDEAAGKFGGILGYPTSFLISRDGRLITRFQGLRSEDDLVKAIESQL